MFNVEYYSVHVIVSGTLLTVCTLQLLLIWFSLRRTMSKFEYTYYIERVQCIYFNCLGSLHCYMNSIDSIQTKPVLSIVVVD